MNIILFSQDESTQPLAFDDERAQHLLRILHKTEGSTFDAGIENGRAGTAQITHIDDNKRLIYFSFTEQTDGKPLYPLRFIIGFPRPIQLKRLFRDAAGLGVSELHLCGTELGEKSYMQTTLLQRGTAHSLLRDGSIQAKSTHVPQVFVHDSLSSCLAQIAPSGVLGALDNIRPTVPFAQFLSQHTPQTLAAKGIWAAVGSERGWTDKERAILESYGFTRCVMGERILRTETAVTVAATLALAAMNTI